MNESNLDGAGRVAECSGEKSDCSELPCALTHTPPSSLLWTCIATCQVCGVELNRAEHVPENYKTRVSIAAPLLCICKVRHHNTLSDCNIGVKLEWIQENPPDAMKAKE